MAELRPRVQHGDDDPVAQGRVPGVVHLHLAQAVLLARLGVVHAGGLGLQVARREDGSDRIRWEGVGDEVRLGVLDLGQRAVGVECVGSQVRRRRQNLDTDALHEPHRAHVVGGVDAGYRLHVHAVAPLDEHLARHSLGRIVGLPGRADAGAFRRRQDGLAVGLREVREVDTKRLIRGGRRRREGMGAAGQHEAEDEDKEYAPQGAPTWRRHAGLQAGRDGGSDSPDGRGRGGQPRWAVSPGAPSTSAPVNAAATGRSDAQRPRGDRWRPA